MSLTKPQLIIFSVIAVVIIIFVLIFAGVIPGLKEKKPTQQIAAAINLWTVFDDQNFYNFSLDSFKQAHPNIQVNIRNFNNLEEYQSALLNALAAGAGPDVFMIQNGSLLKEINKLWPAPAEKYSLVNLRSHFPQVVEQDFVYQNQIYALPLSIDTLALIYNRDLFNQAGVVMPPATWEELTGMISKFVRKDGSGRFVRFGAAIGGSKKTIVNAADILDLIRLQKGSVSLSDQAGQEALAFYIQFVNAVSPYYTWDNAVSADDWEMFISGKLAMIFGYASQFREFKNRGPFLNTLAAPAPQFSQEEKNVAYPRYWGLGVASQSRNRNVAWDLVIYLTTDSAAVKTYLDQSQKPPALNVFINQKINDPDVGIFSRQALIAKSWQKVDAVKVSDILSEAIEAVSAGRLNVKSALELAQSQFDKLITSSL